MADAYGGGNNGSYSRPGPITFGHAIIAGTFYSELIRRVEEETLSTGYDLIMFNSRDFHNSTAIKF